MTGSLNTAMILSMTMTQQYLLSLQQTDAELDSLRGLIRSLQAELATDPSVTARADRDRARRERTAAESNLRDNEAALATLTRTIAMLDKRLYDGSIHNAREAESLQEELAHRRIERSTVEDSTLVAMERLEVAEEALTVAEGHLAQSEERRAQRVPQIKAEGRAATARLQAVQSARTALHASVPATVLSRYERLHATTKPAVVVMRNDSCSACGVEVAVSQRQKMAADEIVQCTNCGRLIVDERTAH